MRIPIIVATLAASLALASCGGPKPPPPAVLDLTVAAGADQNPEIDGHPSPAGIRLYQLASTGSFDRADVYALMGGEAAALGPDLLGSETLEVNPEQVLKVHRALKPGAQFLGVAVMFRDIDHANWRASAPLAASGPTALTLKTAKLAMTLAQ